MTFPEDFYREGECVEDHSAVSIVIVSIVMIGAGLAGLSLFIA